MKTIKYLLLLVVLLGTFSCHEEYTNPSALTEVQATGTVDGLISLVNGLQSRYSTSRACPIYNYVAGAGLTSRSLIVLNPGNTDEVQLEAGGSSVVGTNAIVRNLWEQSNIIKANADLVLSNVGIVADPGARSGLLGGAAIFKALALGNLAMFWEQAPIEIVVNAPFASREEVLNEAIRVLEEAEPLVAANPIPASFYSKAVAGVDVPNSINALIARYALMLGQYDKAIAAANKVNLAVKSEFRFNPTNRNPVFDVAFGNENVVRSRNLNMGLPASLAPVTADARIDFYFASRTSVDAPTGVPYYPDKGFYNSNSTSVPVYLPGEISLILAEAYARKDDLTNATTFLNAVLTKTAATDAWGIGANLPATTATTKDDLLLEIYRNRCIELYLSGMILEDSRRFGRPGPLVSNPSSGDRNRNFYPYPANERDNNTNTPNDPAI